MNWKQWMSRFNWKNKRDQWLFLLVLGLICMIMAVPSEKGTYGRMEQKQTEDGEEPEAQEAGAAKAEVFMDNYEKQLEQRVKELLKNVEGVGAVDVMIVLKSSGETVLHMDTDTSMSSTRETDSSGGIRQIEEQEVSQSAILSGSGDSAWHSGGRKGTETGGGRCGRQCSRRRKPGSTGGDFPGDRGFVWHSLS